MAKTEKDKSTELVEQKGTTALAAAPFDFAADAGAGMEGATADSFAIPFLTVLQKGSPQVDPDNSSAYIEGARPGMILETVTGTLYDGKEGVRLLPAAFKATYLKWGAREAGGGFKGEVSPATVAELRARGQIIEFEGRLYAPLEDGTVNPKRSDRYSEVRNHYCVLVEPNGAHKEVLLSLASTQIKKSKALLSMLRAVTVPGPDGRRVPAPTFASVVRMTTVSESNDKGSWHGVRFVMEGLVDSSLADAYQAARDFYCAFKAGSIAQARYEDEHEGAARPQEGF